MLLQPGPPPLIALFLASKTLDNQVMRQKYYQLFPLLLEILNGQRTYDILQSGMVGYDLFWLVHWY